MRHERGEVWTTTVDGVGKMKSVDARHPQAEKRGDHRTAAETMWRLVINHCYSVSQRETRAVVARRRRRCSGDRVRRVNRRRRPSWKTSLERFPISLSPPPATYSRPFVPLLLVVFVRRPTWPVRKRIPTTYVRSIRSR